MSWSRRITALFSFRRISGQIAALILLSLVLIHALIGLYIIGQKPRTFPDRPVHQFEMIAKLLAESSGADRAMVLQVARQTFPRLNIALREAGPRLTGDVSAAAVAAASIRVPARTAPATICHWTGAVSDDRLDQAAAVLRWILGQHGAVPVRQRHAAWRGPVVRSVPAPGICARPRISASARRPPRPETGRKNRAAAVALNHMRERITG